MKKTNILVGIGSVLFAGSLFASELTVEYRDTENGSQYKTEFAQTITKKGKVNIGGELESKQNDNGSMDAVVVAIAGYNVICNACAAWRLQPFTQVGQVMRSSNSDSDFVGAGLKATRSVSDLNSVQLAYRNRSSYDGRNFDENRVSVSFDHRFNNNHSFGVAAYTYWGTSSDHRVGVFYKYRQ